MRGDSGEGKQVGAVRGLLWTGKTFLSEGGRLALVELWHGGELKKKIGGGRKGKGDKKKKEEEVKIEIEEGKAHQTGASAAAMKSSRDSRYQISAGRESPISNRKRANAAQRKGKTSDTKEDKKLGTIKELKKGGKRGHRKKREEKQVNHSESRKERGPNKRKKFHCARENREGGRRKLRTRVDDPPFKGRGTIKDEWKDLKEEEQGNVSEIIPLALMKSDNRHRYMRLPETGRNEQPLGR